VHRTLHFRTDARPTRRIPWAASQCGSTAVPGALDWASRLQEPAHGQDRAERPADQAQVEHEHRHHPRVVRVLALPARAHAAHQGPRSTRPRSTGSRARAQAGGSARPAGTKPPAPWSRPPGPTAAPARGGRPRASGNCGPARAPPCAARPPRPARARLLWHARAPALRTLPHYRRHGLVKASRLHKSDACCGKCVSGRPCLML